MIIDGSGDINFPSNEPYNRAETEEPEKLNINNPTNPKKKCLIIILVISIIVVLAVGIFLAIYFAVKKKEDGGSITIIFEYPEDNYENIFSEGFNIDDKDFEIEPNNNPRRLLNIPIRAKRQLDRNKHSFKKGTNDIRIKFKKVLTSLEGMFENRKKLVSVDFSELNSKKVININKLLSNCTDLEEAIFNNYDAKKLEKMEHTFENCSKLTILDLSSFSTPKLNSMDSAFKGCTNLLSLIIKNFITDSIRNKNNITDGCNSLIYVDSPSENKDFIKPNNSPENIDQCKQKVNNENTCKECGIKNIGNNINISICLSCTHRYYLSNYSFYPTKCEPCLENCHQCENRNECQQCEIGYYYLENECIMILPQTDVLNSDVLSDI